MVNLPATGASTWISLKALAQDSKQAWFKARLEYQVSRFLTVWKKDS